MKLEFLNDISEGEKYSWADPNQLIRLYDFDRFEACQFQKLILKTIVRHGEKLNLPTLDFIESLNCSLTFQLAERDEGILMVEPTIFICDLTYATYNEIILLIEPFYKEDAPRYQWLYNLDAPIDLLFSRGGYW